MKTVMVGMCVYKNDNPEHLVESINSITMQDYSNFLYIYVDGPVSCDLKEILDTFLCENIFVVYSDVNKGLAYGLNKLITIFLDNNYDYFVRMDADDISLPNRISSQVKYLDLNPKISVLGTACFEFGSSYSNHIYSPPQNYDSIIEFAAFRSPLIHPSVMFRKTVFTEGYRYPQNYNLLEDLAFWYVLLLDGFVLKNLKDPLIKFRMSDDAILRRSGFTKAYAELKLRLNYAKKMRINNYLVYMKIFFKFLLQISPSYFFKIAYKYFR